MTKRYCDKCKKEITEDYYSVDINTNRCWIDGMARNVVSIKNYEICEKCSDNVVFTIKTMGGQR